MVALGVEFSFILALETAYAVIRLRIIERHLDPVLVVARGVRVYQLLVAVQLVIIV